MATEGTGTGNDERTYILDGVDLAGPAALGEQIPLSDPEMQKSYSLVLSNEEVVQGLLQVIERRLWKHLLHIKDSRCCESAACSCYLFSCNRSLEVS